MNTEVTKLALEIADEAARMDLETCCRRDDDGWLDTQGAGIVADDRRFIDKAVRYLLLRDHLERHTEQPHRVRLVELDEAVS